MTAAVGPSTMVQVDSLTRRIGAATILKDVSVAVAPGEIWRRPAARWPTSRRS